MTRNTLHIISHTHWDREWYQTFQEFRLKLIHLVDGLLDILAQDPQFKHFMLDGQTIVLEDYLFMRPEREAELRGSIQNGRILVGPWHILPDEFLVSPEATIRNLLQGARTLKPFGPKMQVGYIPDPFGHIGQMPQILNGFGIQSACLMRGLSDEPCEFWWQAPDGSRVFMAYLRDGYGNAADLSGTDPILFTSEVRRLRDALLPHTTAPHMLLMWGVDHMEPPPNSSGMIASAQHQLDGDILLHSTLPDFIDAVQGSVDGSQLPVVTGELRSPKRHPLLPNVLSARMWIKQRNQACETLLEKWAEPFSAWAEWQNPAQLPSTALRQPSGILRQAWRLLMENHPHDSICGCSIDQVHAEMRPRFDQVEQIGEKITGQSLETLVQEITTTPNLAGADKNLVPIVVFNPSSCPRTDIVTVEFEASSGSGDFDLIDQAGALLTFQTAGLGRKELFNMSMDSAEFKRLFSMVSEGRVAGMVIREFNLRRDANDVFLDLVMNEKGEPNLAAWEQGVKKVGVYLQDPSVETYHVHARSASKTILTFVAQAVPMLGYSTFWARGKPVAEKAPVRLNPLIKVLLPLGARLAQSPFGKWLIAALAPDPSRKPPFKIENEFFSVEAGSDGTLVLNDKRNGNHYRGLNQFVDGGDSGDEYNFCPPTVDRLVTARMKKVRVERGAVSQALTVTLDLEIPESLSPDRKARSAKKAILPITSRVSLSTGVARVDIQSEVDNLARDHRLRVHFPTPFAVSEARQDGHFEVVGRPLDLPTYDESWIEPPRPEVPQRAFTSVSDGRSGITVANRGLPEVEVLKRRDGTSEIAITLLRCVGWLSRDDLTTRKGLAGPFQETPAAQVPGKWKFEVALIPHPNGDGLSAEQQAYAFEAPLRALSTSPHAGALPSQASFIQVEPREFIISAVKTAEDGRGWLVRGYNVSDKSVTVALRPWKSFTRVERANLAEEKQSELQPAPDGRVVFPAKAHEIVTILFSSR